MKSGGNNPLSESGAPNNDDLKKVNEENSSEEKVEFSFEKEEKNSSDSEVEFSLKDEKNPENLKPDEISSEEKTETKEAENFSENPENNIEQEIEPQTEVNAEESYDEFEFITNDSISPKRAKNLTFLNESEPDSDSSLFLNSLENLKKDDIKESKPKKAKTTAQKISDAARTVVFFISLGVFVVCIFMLGENLLAKKRGEEIYSNLAEEMFSEDFSMNLGADLSGTYEGGVIPAEKSIQSQPSYTFSKYLEEGSTESEEDDTSLLIDETQGENEEVARMRAKLNSMKNTNSDVYGWIYVDGTNISYPLVQYTDNEYYLNHAYNGDYLVVGSIYVDFRCDEDITKNFNTVIYGHNITNGTMFNHITKFFNEDFFNNTKIQIYTPDGLYIYEPFAIYETRYDYQYFKTGFTSGQEFVEFASEMQNNSKFNKNMQFTENDRMITLSTCTNGAYYARYALQAKLVSIIK